MQPTASAGIQKEGAVHRTGGGSAVVAHYGDVAAEFTALLTGAALFDGGRFGRLRVSGADAGTFLHNFTTQDIVGMAAGMVRWAVVSNWKGTVVDLVEVAAGADGFTLVTEPANPDKTLAWLNKYIITEDVTLTPVTGETAQIELLGPAAAAVLAPLLAARPEMGTSAAITLGGVAVTLWQHRWVGGAGFRLICEADQAQAIWDVLREAGARPVGADALDVRRILDGVPAYGSEMSEGTNPWEVRLDRAVSLDKGCYLGQEVVARLRTYQKVQRHLVGLVIAPGPVPAAGETIHDAGGDTIGQLTSVAAKPNGDAVMLGLVKMRWATPGTTVWVGGAEATVLDRPFWQP